jgi:hypothetical protein
MANAIKLDWKAIEKILKVQMKKRVEDAAEAIAANVDVGSVTDAPVQVRSVVTTNMKLNRARASVTIAHPAGIAMEAKYGTLRKAAAAAGFEVHDFKGK